MGQRYPKHTQQKYRVRNWQEYEAGLRKRGDDAGYTRRSLVETAMWRYKATIGGSMRGRTLASQKTEAVLACMILNRMTQLGMPDGYCIA